MKAMILCGGLGTRLRSVVSDVPKSMAPIGGKPFLMYQINWLKKYNFTEIILCVGYLKQHIKNYFGNGSLFGVNIVYSEEDELLGTAGAIKNAEGLVYDTFIVLNGDTYAKIDFNKLVEFHKSKNSKYTLGLTKVKESSRYGVVTIDNDNKIINFSHQSGAGSANYINGGVYVFEPEIFKYIASGKAVSLEQEVIPNLINEDAYGHIWEGTFVDMGVPESYHLLQKEILKSLFVSKNDTVREVLIKIDQASLGMALVVDENEKLEGLVTDGDLRRYIIREDDLNQKIEKIMIRNPVTAKVDWSKETIQSLANPRIKHIPIIDNNGIVKDIMLNLDLQERAFEQLTVRAKAPLRISFAGGGTDIWQYFKDFGGCVLNSTIDKYCRGTLVKRRDAMIKIHSQDFDVDEELENLSLVNYSGDLKLIKAVIKLMNPKFGFDLYLHSDVPPGSGLGSSATIAAVVASLLNHLREEKYDDYKISEIIYKAEREQLGIAGGWQDQYATVFGGFNFMEFNREDIIVHPLRISEAIIDELNNNLFLCYTGSTRASGEIQANLTKKQDKDSVNRNDDVLDALKRLKEITVKMRSALLKGKMEELGELLHEGWENKKRLDPMISNSTINYLYDVGIKNGARGGKILGAGGGGYLLFFCSPLKRKQVVKALKIAGGEIFDFNFYPKGVTTWVVKRPVLN